MLRSLVQRISRQITRLRVLLLHGVDGDVVKAFASSCREQALMNMLRTRLMEARECISSYGMCILL